MSRNDGRPRSVSKLVLDPLPWASLDRKVRRAGTFDILSETNDTGETLYWAPRPGFIQDEEAYK